MSSASRRLPRVTELAHLLVKRFVSEGDVVVDATVGNGHDTLFLSDLVGPEGTVYGFDIQQSAIDSAESWLGDRKNVKLIHAGHEKFSTFVVEEVRAVMFNLGYLPGGDKAIKTLPQTTLEALGLAFEQLSDHGLITVVVYPGHDGGQEESETINQWVESLDPAGSSCALWKLENSKPEFPYLVAVEKL